MLSDLDLMFPDRRCDGGVTNNNFLMQLAADLTNCDIDRPKHVDMTSLGAAFLAGLAVGGYTSVLAVLVYQIHVDQNIETMCTM